ncbi:MAG: tyrosine-type recombinase/integrase, partial [Lachnospiraceae bacterium]|nr:tyrosine-type recombinase/integrase [Lachnospiraceae bacterium]
TYLLIHRKGNKERKVSIDKRTEDLLRLYMKEYHPGETRADRPLIYTVIKGTLKAMSHRNVQKLLKKYAAQATINNRQDSSVHPHLLRRSRASGLYQNGIPIEIVSRFLGHSSIETTKEHYAFPSLEQMREAMNKGRKAEEGEKPMWVGHEDELARLCGLR